MSCYLQENGEDDYLDDDHDYVFIDVAKKDIVDNDANGSNENDDEDDDDDIH